MLNTANDGFTDAHSLEQDKKKLDRAFRDYISAHSSP